MKILAVQIKRLPFQYEKHTVEKQCLAIVAFITNYPTQERSKQFSEFSELPRAILSPPPPKSTVFPKLT